MSAKPAEQKPQVQQAELIKRICLEAGVDGVGLVDVGRPALDKEREGILRLYPQAQTVISIIVAYNRENIQSAVRYLANEEYHHNGDRISSLARAILRRLNQLGIRGVVVNKSWPMAVERIPDKIFDVSHKIMAVEAGLGRMGLNRLVLHPQYGGFILLDSILVDAAFDVYDQPLAESPCIDCNLCAAVCPTGAITLGQPFDFLSCLVHTYRDNFIGFNNWVEAMVTAQDMAEYRQQFDDRDTALMWQSLMFRMTYRCSYCMAVCPAGQDVVAGYLADKKAHVQGILKPLKERQEPVYVLAGSKAQAKAQGNPHKQARVVKGPPRPQPAQG